MRRRARISIPIALIALLVQILAPVAASRAAVAAFDPLQTAGICSSHGGSLPGQGDQGPLHPLHDDACMACCLGQAASALDLPRLVGTPLPARQILRLIWDDHTPADLSWRFGFRQQARAPPSFFLNTSN